MRLRLLERRRPQPPFRHNHSRPDLKPPPVQILKSARNTAPGYLFIAPKKDVEQAALILDNRGRVVWFRPLDTHAVTDFRSAHRLSPSPGEGCT